MSTDDSRAARDREAAALSFGAVAEAYDRGRPTYPRDVARWLTAPSATARTTDKRLQVLELGAGTGKLTAELVALGHEVHATDPDDHMLAVLSRHLPDVRVTQASAEEIPARDGTYDIVVSAQAFHWFDLARALPEISRVTRARGRLSLVWNQRDERIPWVRKLGRVVGSPEQLRDPRESLTQSGLFDEVETDQFTFWQGVNRSSIQDLVLSRSAVAVLDEDGRSTRLAAALALYDDYGRGMDGMQLPYVARCFRTTALDRLTPNLTTAGTTSYTAGVVAPVHAQGAGSETEADTGAQPPAGPDGPDDSSTDVLLIDYR